MKKLVLLGLLIGLASCGKDTQSLSVSAEDGLSLVSDSTYSSSLCGDTGGNTVMIAQDLNRNSILDAEDNLQTQFFVCDGTDGVDGINGVNCSVKKKNDKSTITCGESSVDVLDGKKGDKGATGATGSQGVQGLPGAPGIPGLNGSIVEVVDICRNTLAHREVALRISSNVLIAFFQNVTEVHVRGTSGNSQVEVLSNIQGRLTRLEEGFTYETTDNNGCRFKVQSGNIVNL